jgi:hypothetical protein
VSVLDFGCDRAEILQVLHLDAIFYIRTVSNGYIDSSSLVNSNWSNLELFSEHWLRCPSKFSVD